MAQEHWRSCPQLKYQHRDKGRAQRTAAVARGGGVDQRAATVVEKFELNNRPGVCFNQPAALRHCLHLLGHCLGRFLDKVVHNVANLALHPWLRLKMASGHRVTGLAPRVNLLLRG